MGSLGCLKIPLDECVTIYGYGSLMNEESAKRTCPSLRNFRPGFLPKHRRVFSLVSVTNIRSGLASGNKVAAVAATPCDDCEGILGCLFEIPVSDFAAYRAREARYVVESVEVAEMGRIGRPACPEMGGPIIRAFTVLESSDTVYRSGMSEQQFEERVGRFYKGALWGREDILPMPHYLQLCTEAAATIGGEFGLQNWLDTTFLADRQTTIRQYMTGKSCL